MTLTILRFLKLSNKEIDFLETSAGLSSIQNLKLCVCLADKSLKGLFPNRFMLI